MCSRVFGIWWGRGFSTKDVADRHHCFFNFRILVSMATAEPESGPAKMWAACVACRLQSGQEGNIPRNLTTFGRETALKPFKVQVQEKGFETQLSKNQHEWTIKNHLMFSFSLPMTGTLTLLWGDDWLDRERNFLCCFLSPNKYFEWFRDVCSRKCVDDWCAG